MAGDKTDSARVRVEGVMREEANLEMMEILDLFLELLIVRIPLIESSKDLPQAGRVTKMGSWRMGPWGGGSLLDEPPPTHHPQPQIILTTQGLTSPADVKGTYHLCTPIDTRAHERRTDAPPADDRAGAAALP